MDEVAKSDKEIHVSGRERSWLDAGADDECPPDP
jgi:hypothetical protein